MKNVNNVYCSINVETQHKTADICYNKRQIVVAL